MLYPFKAVVPSVEYAQEIVSPPYDVVSRDDARELAKDSPKRFIRISRADAAFDDAISFDDPSVYQHASQLYQEALANGWLLQDQQPAFYVYRMVTNAHTQTGVVALVPAEAYEKETLKKHELIRPKKAEDRLQHILALKAETGPVLLTHRDHAGLKENLKAIANLEPTFDVCWPGRDERHQLWRVNDPNEVKKLKAQLDELDVLYIADGHHRSFAGYQAAKQTNSEHAFILSVLFPSSELNILPYNRIVSLPNWSDESFERQMAECAKELPFDQKLPKESNELLSYTLKNGWQKWDLGSSYARLLGAEALSQAVLDPIFGIEDLRKDERIDFIGGNLGLTGLEAAVKAGKGQCAFFIAATTTNEMMKIADKGEIMPPKSTWFEPKLLDGLVIYPIE